MWIIILGSLAAAFTAGLIYVSFKAADSAFIRKLSKNKKSKGRLICLAFFTSVTLILWLMWGIMNAVICLIHFVVFRLICDAVSLTVSKLRKKSSSGSKAGITAMILCVIYLSYGWFSAHHVFTTKYAFQTSKTDNSYRIIQISDSHVGATFDADGFEKYVEEINTLKPDLVAVTGDFVDDSTSREDMIGGCKALGKLKTKYGVFFVFGNHDRGYFSDSSRGWTAEELRSSLSENGVIILEDEAYMIGTDLCVIGRKDRSNGLSAASRKSAVSLLEGIGKNVYTVMLDHQPYDFDAEANAGADLVLCGHTHGGQFIPINHVGEWIGENCLRYGHEKRLNTDFIVSSGISNWAFKFKTGCISEYVVIDVN